MPTAETTTRLALGDAFQIAAAVHGDQLDQTGEPYLFHITRVAMAVATDEERAVAILHDSIEDSTGIFEANVHFAKIFRVYGKDVADAVKLLTHDESEPYMDYIRRLSVNPLARAVKLADLADNMDEERLGRLPENDRARLRTKYRKAWAYLTQTEDQ